MSRMQELENIFMKAKEKNHHVAIVVQMDGFPANELIVNSPENIDAKLDYYKKTYADNGEHKFAPGIKIVDAVSGFSLSIIQMKLEKPFELGDDHE